MQHFVTVITKICSVNQPEYDFQEVQFNTGIGEEKSVTCPPDGIKISEFSKYSNQPTSERNNSPLNGASGL